MSKDMPISLELNMVQFWKKDEKEKVMMIRKGFIMYVYPHMHEEYERRHHEIWPEMLEELYEHGVTNYSIFLDKETSQLFGDLEIEDEVKWSKMAKTDINQKWWAYMEPVMETNPDKSPVTKVLREVFHIEKKD